MNSSLENWLSEGPYTLALSSHFFGFYSHAALLTQLYTLPLNPSQITGTSAGALVGAALASGLSPVDFKDILFSKDTSDYWDPKWGLGVLAGKKFLAIMNDLFASNFSKTQIPLAVGVVEMPFLKMKFLNSGDLPQAVLASCAVPGLFPPVKINTKWYYDGGVRQKSGINPEDKHQRVLNIYLDSEKKFLNRRKSIDSVTLAHHRVIYLPNTPRVNPRDLRTGQEAYHSTVKRASNIWKIPFRDNTLVVD